MHPADYADLVTDVSPAQVYSWNEVSRDKKVETLAESMARNGWLGRPLLVVADSQGVLRGLTGSSRLAAARRTLDKVPAVVLDANELGLTCDGEDVYFGGDRVADMDTLHHLLSSVTTNDARLAVAMLSEEDAANAQDDGMLTNGQ